MASCAVCVYQFTLRLFVGAGAGAGLAQLHTPPLAAASLQNGQTALPGHWLNEPTDALCIVDLKLEPSGPAHVHPAADGPHTVALRSGIHCPSGSGGAGGGGTYGGAGG